MKCWSLRDHPTGYCPNQNMKLELQLQQKVICILGLVSHSLQLQGIKRSTKVETFPKLSKMCNWPTNYMWPLTLFAGIHPCQERRTTSEFSTPGDTETQLAVNGAGCRSSPGVASSHAWLGGFSCWTAWWPWFVFVGYPVSGYKPIY